MCDCFLEYTKYKDDLKEYKCLFCNKNCKEKFDEKLKEQFLNPYTLSNQDNNKFNCCLKIIIVTKRIILMNMWMLQKNSMKHYYLEKEVLKSLNYGEITDAKRL